MQEEEQEPEPEGPFRYVTYVQIDPKTQERSVVTRDLYRPIKPAHSYFLRYMDEDENGIKK